MFSILKNIPNDGTFDQAKPALSLMETIRYSGRKTFMASLDLSDATNRLAAILQRELLVPFLGAHIAYA